MPSLPQDDARLLKDCLDGKPGAWEAFVSQFAPYLGTVCRRALSRSGLPCGPQEVEDMLQEVFLLLVADGLRALKAYRGDTDVVSYLAVIAVHRVAREKGPLPPRPDVSDPAAPDPLEVLGGKELDETVRRELKALPPVTRLAMAMHGDGAGLREIGQALGLSKDAVATLLRRAKDVLRERLKDLR